MSDPIFNAVSWAEKKGLGAPFEGGAPTLLAAVGRVKVFRAGDVVWWKSGLTIDADGSPRAYHPKDSPGLDYLANAGRKGNWWGVLTDTGKPGGTPVVQKPRDPAPGFCVSTTALFDRARALSDPLRYVDSESVPYLVIPPILKGVVSLGDFALVWDRVRNRRAAAIFADVWDGGVLGEGSIALAQALGIPSSPRHGGTCLGVVVVAFAGSRATPAWPLPVSEIIARVSGLAAQHNLNLQNLPTS